jgi:hypothetical protein
MTTLANKPPPATIHSQEVILQIREILDNNELEQLKEFIARYKSLNKYNLFLSYFFHIIQSSGILVTTVATGYSQTQYIWIGVGLNIFASLLNVIEKNNNTVLHKISKDIQAIREGTFLVETPYVDDTSKKESDNQSQTYDMEGSHEITTL